MLKKLFFLKQVYFTSLSLEFLLTLRLD